VDFPRGERCQAEKWSPPREGNPEYYGISRTMYSPPGAGRGNRAGRTPQGKGKKISVRYLPPTPLEQHALRISTRWPMPQTCFSLWTSHHVFAAGRGCSSANWCCSRDSLHVLECIDYLQKRFNHKRDHRNTYCSSPVQNGAETIHIIIVFGPFWRQPFRPAARRRRYHSTKSRKRCATTPPHTAQHTHGALLFSTEQDR